uniref:fimbrillin family protein n=1 Tax=Candidatus Cryptobacteroides bacterium TaxID=3085639 RepID=UPI003FEEB242
MKKSLIIALGAIALVACTKTSVSYEQTGEIGFAPVVRKNSTKAAVEGTAFPNQKIKVYGYYDNSMATGSSYSAGKFAVEYLPGVEFAKKGATWAGATTPYYWPKTGSMLFAGYSPADFGVVTFSLENNRFSVAELEQPEFYPIY